MEDLYKFNPITNSYTYTDDNIAGVCAFTPSMVAGSEVSDIIKFQIATHPLYPRLISAYIECLKVGAPADLSSLLDEISKETNLIGHGAEMGSDTALDKFMESYCEILCRYKDEVSKLFDEARSFLSNVESRLSNLSIDSASFISSTNYNNEETASRTSEEDANGEMGDGDGSGKSMVTFSSDQEVKEMLLKKYKGYLSTLKNDLLKRKEKRKLPKNAKNVLHEWWNTHNRWPYPTAEEKLKLSELTRLDPKQINNWFINQRKRYWKPSDDMRSALLQGGGGSNHNSIVDL